jgi:YggT family protein
VNALSCDAATVLVWLVNIYSLILLIYAVMSWVPDLRGPWANVIASLVEPLLMPLRRVIPPLGGLDLSFLVLLVLLQWPIRSLIGTLAFNVCFV